MLDKHALECRYDALLLGEIQSNILAILGNGYKLIYDQYEQLELDAILCISKAKG